jgi:hypothetical protein
MRWHHSKHEGAKKLARKMEGAPVAKLVAIPPRMQKYHGKGTMLTRLREKLARDAGAAAGGRGTPD